MSNENDRIDYPISLGELRKQYKEHEKEGGEKNPFFWLLLRQLSKMPDEAVFNREYAYPEGSMTIKHILTWEETVDVE